jgi:hypothetical protein
MTNGADDGEQILELNPGTSKSPERPKLKILRWTSGGLARGKKKSRSGHHKELEMAMMRAQLATGVVFLLRRRRRPTWAGWRDICKTDKDKGTI